MPRCPSCAHENLKVQKFCGECGARLVDDTTFEAPKDRGQGYTPSHLAREVLTSRFAVEGERKLVTVLFCDIANSTQLAARLGAEGMHGLLNRFFELSLVEVHCYEGTINQFLGDGFMALFGAPVAQEDHAQRGLLVATSIQQRMQNIEGPLREVRLRMGLNTGVVVAGTIGDSLRMDYTAIGDTTNLAARLQSFAEPGTIRASDATRRAAQAHFKFKDLGRHALKGINDPVAVFEPLAVRSTSKSGAPRQRDNVTSELVGRELEFATLVRSLATLSDGRGEVVFIRGEPGTGKSRLLAEAKRHEAAARVFWLEGRAISFGRTLSYWPFIEILSAAFGITEGDADGEAMQKLEVGLRTRFGSRASEIVPYLATLMSLELSGDYAQRVRFLDAQAMKRQVFLTMRQLFECFAQRQPVLLVLEDWHWVDQSSVALCEHLLSLTQTVPLTLWLTTRDEPAEPAERIRAAVLAASATKFEEVTLAPLAHEDSATLIKNLVGAAVLPETALSQIQRRTEGNPFFIEEVVRALIADGTLTANAEVGGWKLSKLVTDLAIPDTVQGVILTRIDRLEDGVKSVLRLASVIGRSFILRILKTIAKTTDNVEYGVTQLEDGELIRLRQQVPEIEYIFKHALVQEAAYGSILAEHRRAIHRSVAQAIERLFAARRDEFSGLLAYHYASAEDWDNAYAALLSAGDQAGRIAADAEALEHYRQAQAMFMKVASRDLTPLQRAMMDRKVGQAFYGVGNYEQAVAHFSRALSHLGVRYPQTRAGVLRRILGYLATHFLRTLGRFPDAIGGSRLDTACAREISTICQSLTWLDYFTDESRFALDTLIELDAGERSGDALGRSRGLASLGFVLILLGRHKLARQRLLMANSIALKANIPEAIALSQFSCSWLALAKGSLDEADRTFAESAAAYKAIGDLRGWGGSSAMRIWALRHRAEFAEALALAHDITRVGEGAGDPHVVSWGLNSLGVVLLTIGPLDEAARNLERNRALTLQSSSLRTHACTGGLLGKCYLRQGRLVSASRILYETARLLKKKMTSDVMVADALTSFAELSLFEASDLIGSSRRLALDRAERACASALRLCRKAAAAWRPEAIRLHGTLAWISGSKRQAITRWQKSIAAAETMGVPVERARTLLEMGDRLGDLTLVNEASAAFENLGAKVDHAFALHVLARTTEVSDPHSEKALKLYDQAVASLGEVRAEGRLGMAYRERSQLLVHAGLLNEAQSDLTRAKHYLEASSRS